MENERIEWGGGVELNNLAQDRDSHLVGCCCCKRGNNN